MLELKKHRFSILLNLLSPVPAGKLRGQRPRRVHPEPRQRVRRSLAETSLRRDRRGRGQGDVQLNQEMWLLSGLPEFLRFQYCLFNPARPQS